jgi:hypothetical protein
MTQDKFAQVLGRPDVLKMRASAKNRKHRKDNGKNDKGRWDTWQPPKRKKTVTMHVFGVDTGVGDWGNQDKET